MEASSMMTTVLLLLVVFGGIAIIFTDLQDSLSDVAAKSYEAITIPVKNPTVRDIARSAAYDRRLFH